MVNLFPSLSRRWARLREQFRLGRAGRMVTILHVDGAAYARADGYVELVPVRVLHGARHSLNDADHPVLQCHLIDQGDSRLVVGVEFGSELGGPTNRRSRNRCLTSLRHLRGSWDRCGLVLKLPKYGKSVYSGPDAHFGCHPESYHGWVRTNAPVTSPTSPYTANMGLHRSLSAGLARSPRISKLLIVRLGNRVTLQELF